MIKIPDIIKTVYIQSIGENTQQTYSGQFRVKIILTNAERIQIEEIYNQMISNSKNVADVTKLRASAIAELEVRIVDAPSWWLNSRSGRDLLDAQPLWDLLLKIDELSNEWKQELQKAASKASVYHPLNNNDSSSLNKEEKTNEGA